MGFPRMIGSWSGVAGSVGLFVFIVIPSIIGPSDPDSGAKYHPSKAPNYRFFFFFTSAAPNDAYSMLIVKLDVLFCLFVVVELYPRKNNIQARDIRVYRSITGSLSDAHETRRTSTLHAALSPPKFL